MSKVLVAGGGGFIGGHLVQQLLAAGHDVRSVDLKPLDEWYVQADGVDNVVADLSKEGACDKTVAGMDLVYNLAADMGGMGFIENNKALCMLSVLTNTHLLQAARKHHVERFFFSSSACVYAADKQTDPGVTALKEQDAYPAMPEDGYGWEKLFSERMCRHYLEDFGLTTRVARFHNVYGPLGTFEGGREKAPAAISRKIAAAKASGDHQIPVWGDGQQTRSFMYIDDCLTGVGHVMDGDYPDPVNVGSSELVSIDQLVDLVADIAGIEVEKVYDLTAPQGVRGRNSDNTLIRKLYDWEPSTTLRTGMEQTYAWVSEQMAAR